MACANLSDFPGFVRFPSFIFLKKMQNLTGTTQKYCVLFLPKHMNHSTALHEDSALGTATPFLCLADIFHTRSSPQGQSLLLHAPAASSLLLSRQLGQCHTALRLCFFLWHFASGQVLPGDLCVGRGWILKYRVSLAFFNLEIFLATLQPASAPDAAAAVETSGLEKTAGPNSMFFRVDVREMGGSGYPPIGVRRKGLGMPSSPNHYRLFF